MVLGLLSPDSINGTGMVKSEPLSPTSSHVNSPPYIQQFTINPNYVQDSNACISQQFHRQLSNRGSVGSSCGGTSSFPPSPTNSDISSSSSENFSSGNVIINPQVRKKHVLLEDFVDRLYSDMYHLDFILHYSYTDDF